MVLVVPLEQLLADGNELAQVALHLLVLLRVVQPNMQLYAYCLNGTIMTELALIRLLCSVSECVLVHDTRVARIKRTHFALVRFLACRYKNGREQCLDDLYLSTAIQILTRVLSHVDEPSGLVRGALVADVAPVRDDLIVALHVLCQSLRVCKDIQTDLTRLLRVPARRVRVLLNVLVSKGMASQLAVGGKHFCAL